MGYPVRQAAESAIRQIEARQAEDSDESQQAQSQDEANLAGIERQLVVGGLTNARVRLFVDMLVKIDAAKSRTLLKQIAVGELSNDDSLAEQRAARALINLEPNEAWELLGSENPMVLTNSLQSLNRKPVNRDRLERLKGLVDHDDGNVRVWTAEVIANGVSEDLAEESLASIVRVLTAIKDFPDVDRYQPPRLGGLGFTMGEMYYRRVLTGIANMRATDKMLHELASRLEGRAKDIVYLALVERSDNNSVHDEIVRMVEDDTSGYYRVWAVQALGIVGDQNDLPLLRGVATSDAFQREEVDMEVRPRGPDAYTYKMGFPVRNAAVEAIGRIETRARVQARQAE
jgi:hypothetical protein